MLIVVCEEIETIKKIRYYNEIKFRIYNLMWLFLKRGYVKKNSYIKINKKFCTSKC